MCLLVGALKLLRLTGEGRDMEARHVMTTPVVTVMPDTSIRDVARILLQKSVSAVPVTDAEDHILGIVSEVDLLRRPAPPRRREAHGHFRVRRLARLHEEYWPQLRRCLQSICHGVVSPSQSRTPCPAATPVAMQP